MNLFIQFDWMLFASFWVTLGVAAHLFLVRARRIPGFPNLIWLAVAVLLVAAAIFANRAGDSEKKDLQETLQGFAPTYAYEIQNLGHDEISWNTPPDDPKYLALIDTEKNWLKINPMVNDIYTMGLKENGEIGFLVDSETDYNRDGQYSGDSEKRTVIGENFSSASESLKKAFAGQVVFDREPYTDRWGTWVSAFAPVWKKDGSVGGVLGVDYAAPKLLQDVGEARSAVFSYFSFLFAALFVTAFVGTWIQEGERQKQKLEEQLMQSQKMETVGALAGGVAHDLNNQLTPLIGYLDLLIYQSGKDPKIRSMLEEAMAAAKRCADVVRNLVAFSRPSNLTKTVVSLSQSLSDFMRFIPQLVPPNVQVQANLKPDLWIEANESEIHTVLTNLTINAREAMPNGGVLTIDSGLKDLKKDQVRAGFPAGNYAYFSFKDNGLGISPERLKRIFEPFFNMKGKIGTGMGLTMTFNTIKAHKGWIDVSSKEGAGSRFTIYLPEFKKSSMADIKLPLVMRDANGKPPKILLIDDEEALRKLGEEFLKRLGYESVVASSGQQGLEIYEVQKNEISMVILDMMMPQMSGREVLERLLVKYPNVRVLLASGYSPEASAEELIKKGAADFLAKPYTILELQEKIRKVLANSFEKRSVQ